MLHFSSNSRPRTRILDITQSKEYEERLYRCLAPMPFRKYRRRARYLRDAVPMGFRKKILFFDDDIVGQIEYAPAEVSGLPIYGNRVVVMNCIWVLRRAKGHRLGEVLLTDLKEEEENAEGLATVALENHPSPWMKKDHLGKLGFVSIDTVKMRHKIKHRETPFTAHLMWLPLMGKAEKPTWNVEELLDGVTFCMAHPLYNPQSSGYEEIFERC